MISLVSADFSPPTAVALADLQLRPLTPDYLEADLKAVNDNIDLIRQTRGGEWPKGLIELEEDRADLQEHRRQFTAREAFAYAIFDAQNRYVGCLYIYPPNHPFDDTDKTEMPQDAEAVVSFWVVRQAYDRGLYNNLFTMVASWLAKDWPFHRVYISNREKPPIS